MTNFTKVPWESVNAPGDWGMGGAWYICETGKSTYDAIAVIEYQTPYCAGEKKSVRDKSTVAKANAHLIAAAPDMYEALRVCLNAEMERRKKLLPGAPATTYTQNRINIIQDAISKAEGK